MSIHKSKAVAPLHAAAPESVVLTIQVFDPTPDGRHLSPRTDYSLAGGIANITGQANLEPKRVIFVNTDKRMLAITLHRFTTEVDSQQLQSAERCIGRFLENTVPGHPFEIDTLCE